MASVTVTMSKETLKMLRELAETRERPIANVIDEAIRRLHEVDFWAEVNAAYERLYSDPVARADYEAELASMDGTLADGLEFWPYEGVEELLRKTDAECPESGV